MASNNQVIYKYIKTNSPIPFYYINAQYKNEKLYATMEQTNGNRNGLELTNDDGQMNTYLISVFSSSYIKGIDNREILKEIILNMIGYEQSNIKIDYVLLLGEWDTDKLSNGLYSFNMEFDIKTNKEK